MKQRIPNKKAVIGKESRVIEHLLKTSNLKYAKTIFSSLRLDRLNIFSGVGKSFKVSYKLNFKGYAKTIKILNYIIYKRYFWKNMVTV